MQKSPVFFILPFAALLALTRAQAPSGGPFTIVSWTMDSGGGASTGGAFTLTGTIGQPDSGVLSGGPWNIEGGFWPGVLVQEGTVLLSMRPGGQDQTILYWPVEVTGYTLQWQSSLEEEHWTSVPFPVVNNAAEHTVTVPTTAARMFFRLSK